MNCFEYLGYLLSPYIKEGTVELSEKSLAVAIEGVTPNERRQKISEGEGDPSSRAACKREYLCGVCLKEGSERRGFMQQGSECFNKQRSD
jgi:hypothetical protein